MKRLFILASLTLSCFVFTSCRETEKKVEVREAEPEKNTETAVESTKEDEEGMLERAGKKVDEKVNQEIDEEIDKINDDQ